MPLEIALAGSVLLKALEIGLAAADAKEKWAWTTDDASAVIKLLNDGKEFVGLFSSPAGAPADLVGKHTLIATQAFGAACLAHWGGNEGMAPFKAKRSFWKSHDQKAREKDWQQRLAMAARRMGEANTEPSAPRGARLPASCPLRRRAHEVASADAHFHT